MADLIIKVQPEQEVSLYTEQAKQARNGAVAANELAQVAKTEAEASAVTATEGAALVESIIVDHTPLQNRENIGETNLNPSFLSGASYVNCAISHEIDTISPFRYLGKGYIRKITSGASSGLSYASYNLPIGTQANRPTNIEISFWVQDSNILELFPTTSYYLELSAFTASLNMRIGMLTFINAAVGTKSSILTGSSAGLLTSFKSQAEVIYKYNGWTKFVIHLTELVWISNVATTSAITFYPNSNNAAYLYNKYLYFSNVEVLFNTTIPSLSLYNYPSADGIIKFPQGIEERFMALDKSMYDNTQNQILLDGKVSGLRKGQIYSDCRFTSGSIQQRTSYSTIYDLVMAVGSDGNSSSKLILKSDAITATGIALTNGTDDAAPVALNGYGYIGANHGQVIAEITAAGHGKTVNDVASQWQDGAGNKHYIIEIVSSSVIRTISENKGTVAVPSFVNPSVGNLTHFSGAQNTATFAISSVATYQLPSKKNITYTGYSDGVQISEVDKIFKSVRATIVTTYDVADILSTVQLLVANKPVGGYTTQPSLIQGDAMFKLHISYSLQDGAMYIESDIETLKDLSLIYHGMTQIGFFNPVKTVGNTLYNAGASNTYKRYIPKTLPINLGYGSNSDLRLGVNFEGTQTAEAVLTSSYFENALMPPDRSIDIIDNSNGFKAALSMTYLPYGIGGTKRKDNVSSAWYLFTTKKNYPYAIDSKLHVGGVLPSGTYKQGVVQRKWTNLVGETNHTVAYFAEHANDVFLYADYHAICNDAIAVPFKYRGRTVEVIEKSANVELLSDVATDTIRVKVTTASPMYGYVVLKLK